MNRRSFLKALGLAPVAAALPTDGYVHGTLNVLGSAAGPRFTSNPCVGLITTGSINADKLRTDVIYGTKIQSNSMICNKLPVADQPLAEVPAERILRRMTANMVVQSDGKGGIRCQVKEYG